MLLLLSLLALVSSAQPAKAWNGTIYIETDGTVSTLEAPIERNWNICTLAGNIYNDGDRILVLRDEVVVDRAGQKPTFHHGVDVSSKVDGQRVENNVLLTV